MVCALALLSKFKIQQAISILRLTLGVRDYKSANAVYWAVDRVGEWWL